MDFDFSDDQLALREAVQRWVYGAYSFETRRQVVQGGGFSHSQWRALTELGLTGLVIDEAHGGMSMGAVEAMIVMEEFGRGLVLETYAQAALIAPAMLRLAPTAIQQQWLAPIASGSAIVVLAHQERAARYRSEHVETTAQAHLGTFMINGMKSLVPAGDMADAYIVPARMSGSVTDPSGIGLFLIERKSAGVSSRAYALQDGSRAAEVSFVNAEAQLIVGQEQGHAALELALDIGIAALAAEAVGVMEKLLELTVEYLNTRKQFGVPIGSFQALRHRAADCKMQLELARSMSYYATLKLGEPAQQRRRSLSQAKVQLGQSARFVGQQCTQMHGGIGVTDEYMGSHYFKRLTCMEMQFGDTLHHLGEVTMRMQASAGVFA